MNTIYRSNIYSEFLLILLILGSTFLNTLYAAIGITPARWIRSCLLYTLLFGLPTLFFMRRNGMTGRDIGLQRCSSTRTPLKTVMIVTAAIILALVLQAPLTLLSTLSELVFHNYTADAMTTLLDQPLLLSLLGTAVCPAFFEELACRGIFLSGYRRVRPWISAVLCGIFFGILHLNMQQWVYAFAFGFTIALLQLGTGCLWLPILVHFIINATQLICAYTGTTLFPNLLVLIIAFLISLPIIGWLLRVLGVPSQKPEKHWESLTFSAMKPFLYMILIFIAALLLS